MTFILSKVKEIVFYSSFIIFSFLFISLFLVNCFLSSIYIIYINLQEHFITIVITVDRRYNDPYQTTSGFNITNVRSNKFSYGIFLIGMFNAHRYIKKVLCIGGSLQGSLLVFCLFLFACGVLKRL